MRPGSDSEVVSRAKVLLRETDKSIRDIALRLLFASSESFSNYFRRRVGTSPLRYRAGAVRQTTTTGALLLITRRIELAFPHPKVRDCTLWLPEGYVPVTEDIVDMSVSHADVEYVNGDILRIKRFEKVTYKSAMQRIDAVAIAKHNGNRNTVCLTLTQQSSELQVSVHGENRIAKLNVTVLFNTRGPR